MQRIPAFPKLWNTFEIPNATHWASPILSKVWLRDSYHREGKATLSERKGLTNSEMIRTFSSKGVVDELLEKSVSSREFWQTGNIDIDFEQSAWQEIAKYLL